MDDGPIRAAVRKQIDDIGSLDATVDAIGGMVNRSQLDRYVSLNADARIPLTVAMAIDLAAGRPNILAAAARKLGFRLAPLDAAESVPDAVMLSGSAVVKVATLHQRVLEMAPDGFNPLEKHELRKDVAVAVGVLRDVEAAIGGEK
ncbi:hypothetical protein [Pleomorphomonas oryzae]|uniref:hypothetical protein n=1 Tax=Pleomorphomonas oryzae TaxID=261934 RepID=UPI0003FD80DC|nr:hypothetical protein [Pleomorphomonas oryzae]